MATDNTRTTRKRIFIYLTLLLLIGVVLFAGSRNRPGPGRSRRDSNDVQPAGESREKDPNDKPLAPLDHNHPAFYQRYRERSEMVDWQIRKRGVKDPNVLRAMLTVPRHAFVRRRDSRRAYNDRPLSIGYGQTISQPYIVAYMTRALELKPGHKVLEIGTGSGYQAAVCAEIAREVYTIEIVGNLAQSAYGLLQELHYWNVSVKAGDGFFGWPEKGPFDAVIVTCAAGFIPPPLVEQLKPGGKMILPVGSPFGAQTLVLVTKDRSGKVRTKRLIPVRFVPMVGRVERG